MDPLLLDLTRLRDAGLPWGPLSLPAPALGAGAGSVHVLRWCALVDRDEAAPAAPSSLVDLPLCPSCGPDLRTALEPEQRSHLWAATTLLDDEDLCARVVAAPRVWRTALAALPLAYRSERVADVLSPVPGLTGRALAHRAAALSAFDAARSAACALAPVEAAALLLSRSLSQEVPSSVTGLGEEDLAPAHDDWASSLGRGDGLRAARRRVLRRHPLPRLEEEVKTWEAALQATSTWDGAPVLVALESPRSRTRREGYALVRLLSTAPRPWDLPRRSALVLPSWLVELLGPQPFPSSPLGPVGADPELVEAALALWDPTSDGPLSSAAAALEAAHRV